MSTIAPSSSQTTIGATPVGTPASVQIELNGTSLSADVGNIITGTVLGRDPRGGVQLRTQNGIVVLHTAAKLPPGAIVTLQVQAVGAQIQAILLQVTPLAAQVLLPTIDPSMTLPGHAPAQTSSAGSVSTPASQVALGSGPTVTATVIGPARDGRPAGSVPVPHADAPPREIPSTAATSPASAPQVAVAGRPASDGVAVQATIREGAAATPDAPDGDTPETHVATAARASVASTVEASAPQRAAVATPRALSASSPLPTGLPAAPGANPASAAAVIAGIVQSAVPVEGLPAQAQVPTAGAAGNPRAVVPGAAPSTPLSVVTISDAPPSIGAQATAHAYAVAQGAAPARAVPAGTMSPPATTVTVPVPASPTRAESTIPPNGTAPAAPSQQPAALPARLSAGSELDVRVTRIGESQIQPATAGHPQITGTIAGRTPAGQAIIDTPAGRLALALPDAFGPAPRDGTRLVLDVVATRVAAPLPHDAPPRTALEAASLRPMLDALNDVARASRGHVDPHDILPRPGPQLAQRLADVAAALSTGNVAEWLGERAVKTLEQRGQGEMLRRLEGELYDAAKAAPQSPEWHGTVLPFFVGGQLLPLRLYVKRRNARARERAAGTRFVLECAHDDLGELQLDGLVHERRIDVILRSHAALPEDMRGDIIALFGDACGVMGYAGTLEFHAEPAFPAMPRAERAAHSVGVVA